MMHPYRRLLRFLDPHRWRMLGAVVCNLLAAVFDVFTFTLLIPFLGALFGEPQFGVTGDHAVARALSATIGALLDPADAMGSLQRIILVILGAVALKNLFVWLGGHFSAQLQEYVTRDLRNTVYRHLARLPLGYYTSTRTGQVLARLLTDTTSAKQLVTEVMTRSLQSAATVVVTLIAIFGLSWELALLACVVAPLLIGALQPLLAGLRRRHRRLGGQYGEITSVAQETVSGIRLVKSFAAEPYEERRFLEASGSYSRGMARAARLASLAQPITETIATAVAVGILWYGARMVLVDGEMPASALILFLVLVMRMLQPLKQLSQIPTTAQAAVAAAELLFEILDQPTETALDRGTRQSQGFRDRIDFEHVSFAYDAEPVLHDVSLTARHGEIVALVGASGAGKTTLVDLVPRFYEPTHGRILLDGVDTREIALPSLRALIGIVSQETVLFNDTVRANIAYGSASRFSDGDIQAAARAANAHEFIERLPQGYETPLGERGTRLSGGQRQRIAIARALLVDPPILILDEATSALDTESERLVQEAIERLLRGRTVFVIAHRLSTIVSADQILVLERGRIVERGTHGELLALAGAYARLYQLQFGDRAVPVAT